MIGWAASGVIVKGIDDVGPLAIVFWRMWFYTIIVLAFLYARGTPFRLTSLKFSLYGGIAFGIDLLLFYAAVHYTTIANATVITACLPVFMMLIAKPVFGEDTPARHWLIALVAIGGVAAVAFGSSSVEGWSLEGDLMAIGALVAWGGYFVFSKLSQNHIESSQYTAGSALVATLVALLSGELFVMPSAEAWSWLIILAIGPGFASHMLMNWSIRGISASLSSLLTLAIPIVATLMAWLFLDEAIVMIQVLGILVVVISLGYLVLRSQN